MECKFGLDMKIPTGVSTGQAGPLTTSTPGIFKPNCGILNTALTRLAVQLALACLVLAVAACAADQLSEERALYELSGETVVFDANGALERARLVSTTSEKQLAVLGSGRLEYQDYVDAIALAIECGRAAGYEIIDSASERRGFPQIELAIRSLIQRDYDKPEDELIEWDECYDRHARMVDMVWQLGHADVVDRVDAQRWASLVHCLASNGGSTYPSDWASASDEVRAEAFAEAQRIQVGTGVNCLSESGFRP